MLDSRDTAFGKYSNMRDLQDNDETLFYSMIEHYTEELLPMVYTPAVGEGCQRFSEIWRSPADSSSAIPTDTGSTRFLPIRVTTMCAASWSAMASASWALGTRERAAWAFPSARWRFTPRSAAFRPEHCLPILLDAGTDNEKLLQDPIYIGWQHNRVRGQQYDDFVEAFVIAVQSAGPKFCCSGKILLEPMRRACWSGIAIASAPSTTTSREQPP